MLLAISTRMRDLIVLEQVLPGGPGETLSGSAALDLAEEPCVTLQFAFASADGRALDAIRHARRSMLREEWTRGRDPDEPSLEEAIFSPGSVVWETRRFQEDWCLRKMAELAARANRALAMLESSEGLTAGSKKA